MSAAASIETGRLPHFIIIGAMKCATSTLHEQLAAQLGMCMSDPKEPNFFSDDDQWSRGMAWYRSLFARATTDDLCGESSTHYTKLPTYPHVVERMRKNLSRDVKFIYIMRHPIDRLVSQYIHEWTQRVVSGSIDEALESNPEMIAYSRYAMQLKPFFDAWGRDQILPLFFERFTQHQPETLADVCRFVGHGGESKWDDSLGEQNVSSERMRRSPWRDAVANIPGMTAFRRTLIPEGVRDRIKGMWKMKQRPQLSTSNRARLTEVFDEDLATLGLWFGIDNLRCETFHSVAKTAHPSWRANARADAA